MSTLVKTFVLGRPAIPGTPPIPAKPAYCITEYNQYRVFKDVYVKDTRATIEINVPKGTPGAYLRDVTDADHLGFYGKAWFKIVPNPDYGKYHIVSVATGDFKYVPVTTCFPEEPGSPGTKGLPAIRPDYFGGWTGSAHSIKILVANGAYKFKARGAAVDIVTGFSQQDVSDLPTEILYGIRLAGGNARVEEAGVSKTTYTPYVTSDEFSVVRVGSVITYKKNGTLFYTSLTPSITRLIVDASIFFGGDYIYDAVLVGGSANPIVLNGVMPPLNGVLTESFVPRLHGILPPMDGTKVQRIIRAAVYRGELQNITSFMIGLTGNIATMHGLMDGMRGAFHMSNKGRMRGVMGNLVPDMHQLQVYLLDPAYAIATAHGALRIERILIGAGSVDGGAAARAQATALGALEYRRLLEGHAVATVTALGDCEVTRTLAAVALAAAESLGDLTIDRRLSGKVRATVTPLGELEITRRLRGVAQAVATTGVRASTGGGDDGDDDDDDDDDVQQDDDDGLDVSRAVKLEIPEITITMDGTVIITHVKPAGVESPQQRARVDDN